MEKTQFTWFKIHQVYVKCEKNNKKTKTIIIDITNILSRLNDKHLSHWFSYL